MSPIPLTSLVETETFARLEWSPERDLPSYRGITIDEIEVVGSRDGFRVFVPDIPGLHRGEVSGPAVTFLRNSVCRLAEHRAFDNVALELRTDGTYPTYYVWNEKTPGRVTPLHDVREARDFLTRYKGRPDALLISLTVREKHSVANLGALFQGFARALGAVGWDSSGYGRPTIKQLSPEDEARKRSIELRDELLARGWPTSAQVARSLGSKAGNPAQIAAKKRAEGRLFGVWSVADNTFVHPDFQFDALQQLRPEVSELLDALGELPGMSAKEDPGGWRRAFWLYATAPQLSEAAVGEGESTEPRNAAEVFGSRPQAVIAFARMEASRDPDAEW